MNIYYKKESKRGVIVSGELFITLAKEVKKNKNGTTRDDYKLSLNKGLKNYLEKEKLDYFVFCDCVLEGENTPLILLSKADFNFQHFKNLEGEFKNQVTVKEDMKRFQKVGIEITCGRLYLERISEDVKEKHSLSEHEYLFKFSVKK